MNYQLSPEKCVSGLHRKTNRLFSVLAVVAMLISSFSTLAQSPEVKSAFRLIDIEQPSKGIKALEQLASKGDNSSLQYYLGLGYLRTGDKEKALAAFEKGISLNEKDGLNFAGKGQVKLIDKSSTEAKMLLDKALAISKSKDVNVLRALGEAYLTDTKYLLDAINVLKKAKSINEADPETNFLLGDALILQNPGAGGETVSSYERAARADAKSSAKANYKIARIYQRSKNYDIVFESLNKAVAADPEYAPAWKTLADLYYIRKEAAKAVEALEKYMAISEKGEEAKTQYAFFLFMAKRFDQADAIFKEVLSKPNPPANAFKYRAYALMEKDTSRASAEEAKPLFEQYFQKAKPEEIQASDYAYYGKMLLEIKEDSLANESFATSIEMDSAQSDILLLHGNTYMKRKKYEEAVKAYKQLMALRKEPLSQDFYAIGQAYYYAGQYAPADSAFSQIITKQGAKTPLPVLRLSAIAKANIDSTMSQGLAKPAYDAYLERALQDPEKNKKGIIEAYEYLGAYYIFKEENVAQAKTYYEKILQLDPNHEEAKKFMKTINTPAQKGDKPQQKGSR